jgi:hypothetical protein
MMTAADPSSFGRRHRPTCWRKPLVDRDGRAMLDARGKQRFAPVLEWSDQAAADRFSQAVVDAVRAEHGPEVLEAAA